MPRKNGRFAPGLVLSLCGCAGLAGVAWSVGPTESPASTKLHPKLLRLLGEKRGPVKTWVFFADKGVHSRQGYEEAVERVGSTYNPRAIRRRMLRGSHAARDGSLFDEHDLPVVEAYVDAVAATGARVHITSRWVNAVSAMATRTQIGRIAALPCARFLQPVARSRPIDAINVRNLGSGPFQSGDPNRSPERVDYGLSQEQLSQINLIELHDAGFTGNGVIIGILDTGFHRSHEAFNFPSHPLSVVAEYDFVDNDGNTDIEPGDPKGQHWHGTLILGCLGAYMPGSLIGGAYDASFILCKTEDTTDEYPAEEDNYVAGLEFIEQNGGDMATASLGYIDWYTQDDLDGETAVTTIAVNIATSLGVHCSNAAGNGYHDSDPNTSSLIAPADAFKVISYGAVDSEGVIAWFSSDGPTADGRVKPELLARGVDTHTVSPSTDTDYTTASGTSLSTPVAAGAVACLIQAAPYWTVDRMRDHLFQTADYFVANDSFDPLYVLGYGIIDAFAAYADCNANQMVDECDLTCGPPGGLCDMPGCAGSADCNLNGIPDECDVGDGVSQDVNANGIPDECECLGPRTSTGGIGCDDGDACTVDACVPLEGCLHEPLDCDDDDACTEDSCDSATGCLHVYRPRPFGDLVPWLAWEPGTPLQPDVDDFLCVLDAYSLGLPACPGADLAPCGGDGIVDLEDISAFLDAFAGNPPCPAPCP